MEISFGLNKLGVQHTAKIFAEKGFTDMGSKLDGLAGRGHFLQKIAFKIAV